MRGHELAEVVVVLVEPEVAAQETTALVTVELEEQDILVVVVSGVPSSPWSSFGSRVMRGQELAEVVVVLVEPEVAAQETTALVTVELEEQDALVFVVGGVPSSPWSSLGSMVIRGQALAEEVVIVLALVEPEVIVPQDLMISVTVEVLHDELLEDWLEDWLEALLEDG
ncbi:MAG: hypothetical protein Q9184_002386 [Pyrenodesmia sp. 2 TL-2023]